QRQQASLEEQNNDALSPAIRRLLAEHNLDPAAIKGTGVGGRLPLPTQYQTAIKVSGIMGARKTAEERARDMLYPEQIYQEFE
ncbi:E3 binding domain-containing protein, partial [Klebsiella pneumoniae]|uniref:E3 binding domain-containing protein n=1 Tax=Klebsiella pneumoniae TaxID=573 RepID=UPI0028F40380